MEIIIGERKFQSLGGCNRCKMITIDQLTGTEGSEPLRTLAHYRRSATGRILLRQRNKQKFDIFVGIMFGIHVALYEESVNSFILRVGDLITIEAEKT